MDAERNYLAEFIWMWVKALLLFAVGTTFMKMFLGTDEASANLMGYALAAAVFGMSFFNKVIPFNLFGNTDGVLLFWVLKCLISLIIGMLAFPVVNIYYIVKIIKVSINKFQNKNNSL